MKPAGNRFECLFLFAVLLAVALSGCIQNQQTTQKVPSISDLEAQEERDRLMARSECSERRQIGKIIEQQTGLDDHTISNCFDLLEQ